MFRDILVGVEERPTPKEAKELAELQKQVQQEEEKQEVRELKKQVREAEERAELKELQKEVREEEEQHELAELKKEVQQEEERQEVRELQKQVQKAEMLMLRTRNGTLLAGPGLAEGGGDGGGVDRTLSKEQVVEGEQPHNHSNLTISTMDEDSGEDVGAWRQKQEQEIAHTHHHSLRVPVLPSLPLPSSSSPSAAFPSTHHDVAHHTQSPQTYNRLPDTGWSETESEWSRSDEISELQSAELQVAEVQSSVAAHVENGLGFGDRGSSDSSSSRDANRRSSSIITTRGRSVLKLSAFKHSGGRRFVVSKVPAKAAKRHAGVGQTLPTSEEKAELALLESEISDVRRGGSNSGELEDQN